LAALSSQVGAPPLLCRPFRFTIPAMSIRQLLPCLLGPVLLLLAACSGTRDTRVNPDAPDTVTGTGLQSQDVRTMATDMAAKIKASGVLAPGKEGERASFFIYELRNDSSDTIDKELILTKLRTNLFEAFGRQVKIIDRSPQASDLVDAERRMKERGQVSGTNDRKIAGSDYVLKGTIKSRDRQAGKLKSSYVLVTFELTDLVTQELAWTGYYDMKTESEKSVINR
jgi:PBP1b-binding outer membrane lipoprotein LpoB